jgi:hypothetical protein
LEAPDGEPLTGAAEAAGTGAAVIMIFGIKSHIINTLQVEAKVWSQ